MVRTRAASALATATWVCSEVSVVTKAIRVPSGDHAALCSSHTAPGHALRRTAPDPSAALTIHKADTETSAPLRLPVTTFPYTTRLPSGEMATSLSGCTELSTSSAAAMGNGCSAAAA